MYPIILVRCGSKSFQLQAHLRFTTYHVPNNTTGYTLETSLYRMSTSYHVDPRPNLEFVKIIPAPVLAREVGIAKVSEFGARL
jgi:hypothetical protein